MTKAHRVVDQSYPVRTQLIVWRIVQSLGENPLIGIPGMFRDLSQKWIFLQIKTVHPFKVCLANAVARPRNLQTPDGCPRLLVVMNRSRNNGNIRDVMHVTGFGIRLEIESEVGVVDIENCRRPWTFAVAGCQRHCVVAGQIVFNQVPVIPFTHQGRLPSA